jgi:hydrophobe/amphiphile efflux-1 (HAE1) family protein
MRLNVSAWSIRRPIPAAVVFVILTLLGIVSFRQMAVTRFPNIDIPIVQVAVTQSGAAPSELESQVTKKVEDAVSNVPGVWHMISTVTDGSSVTIVQFTVGAVDVDRALNDVKDQIAKIRADLPRTIDEPIVSRIQAEGLPFVTYAASAPGMTAEQLSWFVDDTVARELQSVKGVGEVKRFGGVDREIRVALDPDKLLALGVTAAQVNAQLRADNIDLGGGRAELAGQEQAIRTLAGARTVADLAATPIALPGDRRVRLDELAKVTDGAAEPRTFARLFDEPIVSLGVTRSKGASDVAVDRLVAAKLARIQGDHPEASFVKVDTQVDNELGNYSSTMETLIEGALLSVIVVLVFLRDLRATIVTALALPLSILPAFWAMDAIGFSLNLVSLLAITLVTGILVDDAIVEIENIVRHMRMGKSAYRASLEAADEIGLAVIAISLTIVAIFSPVSFMSGIAGQYFRQFGLTVAIAVVFSLLVARFVTPVLAAYFLRAPEEPVHREGAVMRFYTRLVRASVRHRWITLAAGVMIFAASIAATKLLPSGFLPADDQGRALLALELPPGSRLDDTDHVTRGVSDQLKKMPEVRSVLIYGGQILGGAAEPRKATFVINFVHKSERNASQKDLQAEIGAMLASTPDVRYWFVKDNGQRDLSLIVAGPDIDAINDTANQLASEMRSIPTIENPISTAELDRPELRVTPKRQLAADLGVSTETLSETIRVATLGDVDANLAKFNAGDRLVPIRVELDESARGDVGRLQDLRVPTGSGGAAPLSALADFVVDHGPTAINRYDRTRRVTIEGDLAGDAALGDAVSAIRALPAAKHLPPGVEIRETGDVEVMGEVFASFAEAIGAGVMMVYALLVLLFGGFLQPITILVSLPLSVGGAIGALLITHKAMSMPVVIGILMLMGIVTKNAIMLVDFAVEEIGRGTPRLEALVEAGRKRARPIIMTTIAMAAGMFPSALGLGDGGGFRSPMAIAVMGGLAASTLLSLVFVPAVFTLIDDLGGLIWRVFGRFVGKTDEATHPRPVTRPEDEIDPSALPMPGPAE